MDPAGEGENPSPPKSARKPEVPDVFFGGMDFCDEKSNVGLRDSPLY